MSKMLILTVVVFVLCFNVNLYASEDYRQKTFADIYKSAYEEGQMKGYDVGFAEGYRKAILDFQEVFNKKLDEYKSIEAGKFLVKNWYISYPKIVQVPTTTGVEIVVEGCQILRPFDDLVEQVYKIAPVKSNLSNNPPQALLKIQSEKDIRQQMYKKVSKSRLDDVQKHGYTYTTFSDKDYIIVYFPHAEAAVKFCSIYTCED